MQKQESDTKNGLLHPIDASKQRFIESQTFYEILVLLDLAITIFVVIWLALWIFNTLFSRQAINSGHFKRVQLQTHGELLGLRILEIPLLFRVLPTR